MQILWAPGLLEQWSMHQREVQSCLAAFNMLFFCPFFVSAFFGLPRSTTLPRSLETSTAQSSGEARKCPCTRWGRCESASTSPKRQGQLGQSLFFGLRRAQGLKRKEWWLKKLAEKGQTVGGTAVRAHPGVGKSLEASRCQLSRRRV